MTTKKFSATKTFTKKNIESVPADKPGVYRIKNSTGDVLYVGMAKGTRLNDRIAEHKGEFKGGTRFQYKVTTTKEAAERLERNEVREYRPIHNKDKK